MLDISLIPNRDRLLENTYTETPMPLITVVDSGILPSVNVSSEITVLPDLTQPSFEIDGRWVFGSDIQTFYHKAGATLNLIATWWALKDEYSPQQIQLNVAPEIVAASQNLILAGLKRIITVAKEKTLHTLITTTGNYASASYWETPSSKWDDATKYPAGTTSIINDINVGINTLNVKGLTVEAMIIPLTVYRAIKFAPELKNVYMGREKINVAWLQDFFEIPTIIVPNVFTTGLVKKVPVVAPMWGDDVVLMHLENVGAGTYPSVIVAQLEDVIIQNLPLNAERLTAEIIARECKGYNFVKNDAAYLLKDVLT